MNHRFFYKRTSSGIGCKALLVYPTEGGIKARRFPVYPTKAFLIWIKQPPTSIPLKIKITGANQNKRKLTVWKKCNISYNSVSFSSQNYVTMNLTDKWKSWLHRQLFRLIGYCSSRIKRITSFSSLHLAYDSKSSNKKHN